MSTATEQPPKPAAVAPETPAAPPAPELQQAMNDFARGMMGKKPEPEAPDKPAESPAKKDEPPKAAAPVVPAKKGKKAAARPAPAAVEHPDNSEMIAATAKATGEAVAAAMRPKESDTPKPEDDLSFMTEAERDQLPILERMEQRQPARYKGLRAKYTANLKEIAAYQSKWETENPNEEFDPEAKEHNDFYKTHSLDWSDLDEQKAIADMVADEKMKTERAATGAKLTELEQRERRRELEPKVYSEAKRVGKQVFEIMGGEFKNILNENGQPNQAVIDKIIAEDPMAAEILFQEVTNIERLAAKNYQLFNGVVNFNKADPAHAFLARFGEAQEQAILALPKPQQVNAEGKKFSPSTEYWEKPEKERANFYTLSVTDLNNLLAAEYGAQAVKKLEIEKTRMETMAQKYGYSKQNGGGQPPAKGATPAARAAVEDDEPPAPVTTTSTQLSAGAPAAIPGVDQDAGKTFVENMMGRKFR
jgi:hypothetical protein